MTRSENEFMISANFDGSNGYKVIVACLEIPHQ
jgi:hypothetical protein